MRKPTYYLWRNDFSSQEEFEAERRKYADIGFRVVTFLDYDSLTNLMEITIPHTLNITKYQILLLAHNKFSQLSVFALIDTKSFL